MRTITTDERGYLWLSMVDSMSIAKKYELLDVSGGIEELYTRFVSHMDEAIAIAGNNNFARLSYFMQDDILDKELERLDSLGIDIISIDSSEYPDRLREIDTAPLLLFVKGNKDVLNNDNSLSVVGSRNPSRYGKDVTKMLVRELARAGVTIVSGLARGVDSISHRTTLEEDGTTIAVVANGLDSCYPSENHELMERICAKGAVISEYPLGAAPLAYRFPERNRIISGISSGTLVTEASSHSGSLITLNDAIDQGRNIYLVPGPINTPNAAGGNEAIKELQGAVVTSTEDILKDYNLVASTIEEESIPLSDSEARLVEYIKAEDRHIDDIASYIDMDINVLLAVLSKLELYGLIQKLPGNYYGK